MSRQLITIFVSLLAAPLLVSAQVPTIPTWNMGVLGHVEPITTAEAGGLHNSCWGYVAPDGHEYALFGTYVGTYIIDLDVDPIREVAFIPGPHSTWRNMKTWGSHAYIVTENRTVDEGAGLQIVDLSQLPDTAVLVRTDTTLLKSAHTIWIADHYLYALGTRAEAEVNGGALILDLEPDPLHPVRVGGVAERYYHDAFVRNDTLVGAAINDGGADIVDVSDKGAPRVLGRISYPFGGTHNTALTADGRYVLTSDEVNFTRKTLKVWDISDLDDIVLVAEYSPNLDETIHNVRVRGRYAFVAWYTAGVRVLDMIDPRHPREVRFADTYGGPDGGFNGAWEVYPFLPSGRVIASDRNSGLYLLAFNGAEAGSISGQLRGAPEGKPVVDAELHVEGRAGVKSGPDGSYYLGGVIGEEITFQVRRFGYYDTTITRRLDGEMELDIELRPRPFSQVEIYVRDGESGEPLSGFAWMVDGVTGSRTTTGPSTSIDLPEGVDYHLVVGAWGYRTERRILRSESISGPVEIALERGYVDDATLDLGWQSGGAEDNATTGIWTRLEPYLGYPRSYWVHPAAEPAGSRGWIFLTGSPPRFAPPEQNDVSGGITSLVSPAMDLRMYDAPMIVFDRWFVHFERDTVLDAFTVELSSDNGATWHEAYRETKGKAGWRPVVLFPRDVIPLTHEVRLRIRVSDVLGNILVVAGMDNFEVLDRVFSDVEEDDEEEGGKLDLSVRP